MANTLGLGPSYRRFESCYSDFNRIKPELTGYDRLVEGHYGVITQLGECVPCKDEVEGSNPFNSTEIILEVLKWITIEVINQQV